MELTKEWIQSQYGIGVEFLQESVQDIAGTETKCVRFDTLEDPFVWMEKFVLQSPQNIRIQVVQQPDVIEGFIRLTDDGLEGTHADHNFSYKITTKFLFYMVP